MELTASQLAALRGYAVQRGRYWKSALLADWLNERCQGDLQAIRNAFGSSWLMKFKLPKETSDVCQ
jgi:hypothetical protein